jgi:uncharacterized delta-60 repeat protein
MADAPAFINHAVMKKLLFILLICAVGMDIKSQVIDSTFGIPTSLDPCCLIYGTTGCNFGGFDQAFLTVHLDDGRILLAGDTRWQGESDFAIARLMPDGQYDQTAGPDGQVRIDLGYPNDSCLVAARYQDDRILMGGCVWRAGTTGYVNLIARIDFNGGLDPSFGNNGHLTIDLPNAHEMITRILPQPDGKILVAGNAIYGSFDFPDSVDVFLLRLLPDGQIDDSFGSGGVVYHHWEQDCNAALLGDIALDAQGRVVATGGSYDPYPNNYGGDDWCSHNIFMCRYLSDGQLDPGFGINGSLELAYTGYGRGNALLQYEDGRILLAGAAGDQLLPFPAYVFLARFMPDGNPDLSFGDNGRFKKAIINPGSFSGGNVEPFGLLRIRERILVGVSNEIGGDDPGFGAVCLTEAGKIDSAFGDAGRFNTFPDLGLQSYVNQISSTADNNLFLSGYTRILQPNNMVIVKVRWDIVSSVNEQSMAEGINIYPNPVQDGFFQIDLKDKKKNEENLILRVRDLNGRICHEQNRVRDSCTVNTSQFPSGLYFVELIGSGSRYAGKLSVQGHE